MEGIITQFGILFLLIALFTFEGLFKLLPVFSILAEIYSLYLDSQKKTPQQKELSKNQKLTWQELKKHDNQSSAYVAIKGKVYDVTSFLNSHPGGREFLLLNCGRDATLAFQSQNQFISDINLQKTFLIKFNYILEFVIIYQIHYKNWL